MGTTEKITIALLKYGMIFILWIVLSIYHKASAQEKEWEMSRFGYAGIEASFGIKQVNLKSSIPQLDGTSLIVEGGNAGAILGNSFSRFIVRPLGFYSATANFGRTINLFAVEAENNTYLIRALAKKPVRVDVYTLVGLNFSSYKFFGHYISEDFRPGYNNKSGKEPYLGKMESLSVTLGLGIEYRLLDNVDFVHIFLAGKYLIPMQLSTDSDAFRKTEFSNNFDLSLGLRFGIIHPNKEMIEKL